MRECEEMQKELTDSRQHGNNRQCRLHNSCIGHQELSTKEQGSKESVSVSFLLAFPIRLQLLLSTVPMSKVPI